jgi:hypothetical protein
MRLSAAYRHFWATGKTYQHFWASATQEIGNAQFVVNGSLIPGAVSASASVSGVTLIVNSSLIAGAVTVTEPGQTFVVQSSLIAGATSVTEPGYLFNVPLTLFPGDNHLDVIAPLNTRLNARYRHFWNRRRTIRHFWAQWEGAGITGSLADGDLVVASLADFMAGDVHADANLQGATFTVTASLMQGDDQVIEPGEPDLTITTALVQGAATAEAFIGGQTLTVSTLLPDVRAPFSTITITSSLIAGEVYVPPDALAIPEPLTDNAVNVILFPGVSLSDAAVVGVDQQVVVELIAGEASGNADAEGATLPVDVSLIDGHPSSDAVAPGNDVEVVVSIVAGVAAGEDGTVTPSVRAGGPFTFYRKPPTVSQDAQAFGANFTVGYGIVARKVYVDPIAEFPQPSPPDPTSHLQPVDVRVLPESITKLLELPQTPAVQPEPVAVAPEPVRVQTDWTQYDNELLELI